MDRAGEEHPIAGLALTSSFRDAQCMLLATGDRIFRIVSAAGMADLEALLASAAAAK